MTTNEHPQKPAPQGRASRRPGQEYKCAHCGDIFRRTPSNVKSPTPCCSRECSFALKRGEKRSLWKTFACAQCGKEFEKRATDIKDPDFAFCSSTCYRSIEAMPEEKAGGRPRTGSNWGDYKGSPLPEVNAAASRCGPPLAEFLNGKYLYYRWPKHPIASATNGRVAEHRVVAYEHVGEAIRGHHVDHINNDGLDNRWENLSVLTPSDHARKTATYDRAPVGFWAWARAQPDILARWEQEGL